MTGMQDAAVQHGRIRVIWCIAAAVLVIVTLAQFEEHRRHERIIAAREAWLAGKERARQMILEHYRVAGAPPARGDTLWSEASVPAPFPPPPPEHRRLVTRLRRALALGAFVIWVELLGLVILGSRRFKRRHAPVIAHAMMTTSLLGTALLLLRTRSWQDWRNHHLTADPAGLGLIAVLVSMVVFFMQRRSFSEQRRKRRSHKDHEPDLSSSS
jgi:hypothetical protein